MNDRGNQKKLIQAFKTFFDKSLNPYVSSNESIMNEWKHFNRLISTDPLDISQVQFYLILANKPQHNQNLPPNGLKAPNYEQNFKYSSVNGYGSNKKIGNQFEKINSNSKAITSPKKKNLVACLGSFHNLLMRNQQKLQSFDRKQAMSNNSVAMGMQKRYY